MKQMKFLATQKFRLDLAASFLMFINFALLIITASDNIILLFNVFGLSITKVVLIPILFVMIGTVSWLFGYFMDEKLKYWDQLNTVMNQRNPQITEILEIQRRIESKLNKEGGV